MAKRKYKTYTGPRLPKNPEAKKRYRVYYYRLADTDEYAVMQDTSGSTDSLSPRLQAGRWSRGCCRTGAGRVCQGNRHRLVEGTLPPGLLPEAGRDDPNQAVLRAGPSGPSFLRHAKRCYNMYKT